MSVFKNKNCYKILDEFQRTTGEKSRNKVLELTQQEDECTEGSNFVTDSLENVKVSVIIIIHFSN